MRKNYDELVQLVFFFNKIKFNVTCGKYNLMVGHKTGSLPSPLILNIKFCKNFFIISIIYMRWPTNWDGEGKNRHCA